jgi:hypothetical protein
VNWKRLFIRFLCRIGLCRPKTAKLQLPTSGTSAANLSAAPLFEPNPFSDLPRFIPKYLHDTDIGALAAQFKNFPDEKKVYTTALPKDEINQGDVWTNLQVRIWETGEPKTVEAVILSNSCDIEPANNPPPHRRIMFAPTLVLERFAALLEQNGRTKQQVDDMIGGIRRQQDSGILYLPEIDGARERFVFLDHVYSQPLTEFRQQNPQRISAFSQYGFYVLLIKLSIHFLRVREGVLRG